MLPEREPQSDALLRLLDGIEPDMARIFFRYRVPAQDAEDIVQDCLLALITRTESIRHPEAWIIGTLRNRCFLYWRSRRRQLWEAIDSTLLEELAGTASPSQDGSDVRRDLSSAIDRLPKRCRSVLQLRYGLDCDGAEIAERLGYRPSSIRQITNRCIAALTQQLVAVGYCDEGGNQNDSEPASLR